MKLFTVATLIITPAVQTKLGPHAIMKMVERHQCGQWGVIAPVDHSANDATLKESLPASLWSAFPINNELPCQKYEAANCAWVETSFDRAVTVVRLPGEAWPSADHPRNKVVLPAAPDQDAVRWYVQGDTSIATFATKIEAEARARVMFPDEDADKRYARIFFQRDAAQDGARHG